MFFVKAQRNSSIWPYCVEHKDLHSSETPYSDMGVIKTIATGSIANNFKCLIASSVNVCYLINTGVHSSGISTDAQCWSWEGLAE